MIKIKDGIEENFLQNSVKTISRGGDFEDGKRSKQKSGINPSNFR